MIPRLPPGFSHPMRIGEGGFAAVYRVRQKALDRWVAIKILHEKNPTRKKELLKEGKIQAQLALHCVPQVIDAYEWKSRICIVMQWVKGVSLTTLLEQPLSAAHRLCLAQSIIEGLAELHARGLAHRDIKPDNILVSPGQGIFFVDFGFARNATSARVSAVGQVKGTYAYIAPELWESSGTIDFLRADLFSAGKVLAALLHNQPEHTIVAAALQEEPAKRPASGVELLSQWRALVPQAPAPNWEHIAGAPAAHHLSKSLVRAAQELLYAKKEDQAYWLLVESLEENADNAEALKLINEFPARTKASLVRRNAIVALAACCALMIVAGAFFMGRESAHNTALSLLTLLPAKHETAPRLAITERSHTPQRPAALRQTRVETSALAGVLQITGADADAFVIINKKDTLTWDSAATGITLSYGEHEVAVFNRQTRAQWRKHITLLPFQHKSVSFYRAN